MSDPRPDVRALALLDDALLDRLRALTGEGYDAGFIARAEAIAPRQLDAVRLPLVHAWLRACDEPAAIAARLFGYRDEVDARAVIERLGAPLVDALIDARALPRRDDRLRARLRLMPFAELLLASDEVDARHDPVMGPGATTFELWRACSVPAGARVLDIGCGAGSLALACARAGAGEVVGVDLDPRAIAYAGFNARLNHVTGARFEVGDLAAPVAGEQFELVISQPPFVTQPPSIATTTYLHGGRRGDELSLRMLAQLPALLTDPGGRALVLFDTADDDALIQRITAALGQAPLRVVAVCASGLSADLQALGYASTAHAELGPAYADAAIAYREHLAELGIERTRHVLLAIERVEPGVAGFTARVDPRGAQVYDAAALAELRDALDAAARPDPELLGLRVRVSPHAWFVHERSLSGAHDDRLRVRFEAGRASDRELSHAAAALLELLAESDTLAETVERYAKLCDAEPAEVAGGVARFVRDSLVSGLLVLE